MGAFRNGMLACVLAAAQLSCSPNIGDDCTLSTDCSSQGDRLCDTTQPGGYCTAASCSANSCPDDATCTEFYAAVPGCLPSDRTISRVGRTFCMATCNESTDCRSGYICAHPAEAPWYARIADDDRSKRICLVAPRMSVQPPAESLVCSSDPVDAGFPAAPDAGVSDAGTLDASDASENLDAGLDASPDTGLDAGL